MPACRLQDLQCLLLITGGDSDVFVPVKRTMRPGKPEGEHCESAVRILSASTGRTRRRCACASGVWWHVGHHIDIRRDIGVRGQARTRRKLQARRFADLQQYRLLDELYFV